MKIAITADSVVDLTNDLLEKYDIKTISFKILLGDNEYSDKQICPQDIFKFVEENKILPKTSAINEQSYIEFFTEILKDCDKIVHINLSSGLSTTYNNAVSAASKFDGKIEVVDSKNLSTGVGLLAIYARELTKTSDDIKEIAEKVRNRVNSVQASFVVERLDYLHKGGRCSAVALLGANILKIRPQIIVKDGKMGSHKKYRGPMPAVITKYCQDVFAEFNHPDKSIIFITYTSATPEMLKAVHEVVDHMGFENVYETNAGCTITSHCGENTLGILYFNDGE